MINFYSKIPRRIRILFIFTIIILLAYFVIQFLIADTKTIPDDFLRARQEASLIAQEIVFSSNESVSTFSEISNLDKEGKYAEALTLVSQEIERNRQAREKAIKLSVQLEIMARNISKISPASAGQIALEAITSETALISRLVTYNSYLSQLLDLLRDKFLGKSDGDNIPELIIKINDEIQAINDLNQKFNKMMEEFDLK
jgi:hypothetical protein